MYVKPLMCELGCVSCVSPAVRSREHVACVDFVGAGVARPDCLHFLYFYCHNSVSVTLRYCLSADELYCYLLHKLSGTYLIIFTYKNKNVLLCVL